jgi:PmbA protein
MKNEMLDLAAWTLETAKAAGADHCRAGVSADRSVEIGYRDRKPETIKEASTRQLYVEVFVNGRYSSQTTSDLRKDALRAFVANAVAATKLLAEDPFRTLPDQKYYAGRAETDLKTADPSHADLTPETRHAYVKALEAACLAKGGDKVISVSAQEQDSASESILVASNGLEGAEKSTTYALVAEMTARDAGDRRPNGYAYAVTTSRKALPRPEDIGALAAERTLELLGAKKLKTETLPVIIENQVVPNLLDGLLAPMFGRNIHQKQSFLADKKGKKIASRLLTLVDDPFIEGGLRSRLFDGEGLAARRRVMIEEGVLKDFYIDWYYGRKLGWEPTSGSTSNLVIPPGKRPVAEIMKDLGRGILITGFIGGNSNATTGDASIGIIGRLFEKGESVQAVAEMNIADNHLKLWERLVEVGNDPWPYSFWRTPSIVLTDVVVSGI